jgi:hypothetical protein
MGTKIPQCPPKELKGNKKLIHCDVKYIFDREIELLLEQGWMPVEGSLQVSTSESGLNSFLIIMQKGNNL